MESVRRASGAIFAATEGGTREEPEANVVILWMM